MSGSTFGKIFRITTWGESHGSGIGVVIDGCPSGISLNEEDIQIFLDRRKPGQSKFTTRRSEEDTVEILSGIFEGKTTGTPISLLVRNKDQRSRDYGNIVSMFRPGHADYPFTEKYGIRDYRGGGRSSGRETIGRVAAGAIASKILNELGISLCAYTKAIGPYVIECIADGLPVGLGEPVFDKLDALLAQAVMSIGAVKGVEIGDGFQAASSVGSKNNDPFYVENGEVHKKTNHSGGTLGGMSDGSRLIVRAAVKPTSSIAIPQETINTAHENTEIVIHGRHDPVIVPRAVVVVEAMTAITLTDLLLQNMTAKMDHLKQIYTKEI